jgi:hypothetical protein
MCGVLLWVAQRFASLDKPPRAEGLQTNAASVKLISKDGNVIWHAA